MRLSFRVVLGVRAESPIPERFQRYNRMPFNRPDRYSVGLFSLPVRDNSLYEKFFTSLGQSA
ncbi:hypothetical protein ALQ59_102970 [Pseudomonas syringae pv. apii]|uniref:Uncharacterized protein n=1 Tax=Pseudomonas syringae pv. apii TaxID=81036 RepID=A0A3M3RK68_9PSED|nr:hypothetical protein ALQ59_102970 [Pseudomonas syringae pv. apii]RMN54771.1 hypothetical protein ALQ58_102579 [Pseudomonas syringae pv. apii]RMN96834.1 hypothetical protein ALQ49_102170 [Pseudomonas syringae pv. apii]